jgi:ketosteroid isomerase-like protein
MRSAVLILAVWTLVAACRPHDGSIDGTQLRQDVLETERAFARTMATRDRAAFAAFLADDAIFFGDDAALRGKQAVAAAWAGYFDGEAPFSWEPEQVEVLDSGDLALTSGPVYDPRGTRIATFNSIWRRQADGTWRIVFDKGNAVCASP